MPDITAQVSRLRRAVPACATIGSPMATDSSALACTGIALLLKGGATARKPPARALASSSASRVVAGRSRFTARRPAQPVVSRTGMRV
ncbi:hypothetical protein GCM10025868_41830 [Angustibacter aerolatus]|uniref:Uncharacterized protein n=1 Tax=Angustibacter aerolatus TaxID=1162965 RepID=A0ABQ6JL43_9ACTN|nr:hypothetical protein GCM10025868_41830 [Angustibacter aerolatus]